MAKAIITVDVPDDCYKIKVDSQCMTPYQIYAHEQEFEGYDIKLRKLAYEIFQEKLEELSEKLKEED